MTRDEHRAKCIEAMVRAHRASYWQDIEVRMATAFDALHGIARVVPAEEFEDLMFYATADRTGEAKDFVERLVCDLTNPPEGKP
jgi:hypothetical protein